MGAPRSGAKKILTVFRCCCRRRCSEGTMGPLNDYIEETSHQEEQMLRACEDGEHVCAGGQAREEGSQVR